MCTYALLQKHRLAAFLTKLHTTAFFSYAHKIFCLLLYSTWTDEHGTDYVIFILLFLASYHLVVDSWIRLHTRWIPPLNWMFWVLHLHFLLFDDYYHYYFVASCFLKFFYTRQVEDSRFNRDKQQQHLKSRKNVTFVSLSSHSLYKCGRTRK